MTTYVLLPSAPIYHADTGRSGDIEKYKPQLVLDALWGICEKRAVVYGAAGFTWEYRDNPETNGIRWVALHRLYLLDTVGEAHSAVVVETYRHKRKIKQRAIVTPTEKYGSGNSVEIDALTLWHPEIRNDLSRSPLMPLLPVLFEEIFTVSKDRMINALLNELER